MNVIQPTSSFCTYTKPLMPVWPRHKSVNICIIDINGIHEKNSTTNLDKWTILDAHPFVRVAEAQHYWTLVNTGEYT